MKNEILVLSLFGICLQACSSTGSANQKVDQELTREPQFKSRADFRAEQDRLIREDRNLNPIQRAQLVELRDQSRAQLDLLRDQSFKLHDLLTQHLLAPNYNADEVNVIKDRIQEIEKERTQASLDAADQAAKILGHSPAQDPRLLMLYERSDDPAH